MPGNQVEMCCSEVSAVDLKRSKRPLVLHKPLRAISMFGQVSLGTDSYDLRPASVKIDRRFFS